MKVGYHASHEQFAPSELLRYVGAAERAGFEAAMCSDHIAPFSLRQGHSGHAWSWLGAALATTGLSFGTVNAPGQRYHPVIVAQAAATLAGMYPGRFWLAVGSGEFVNEHVTGEPWPDKDARNRRLLESIDVMRRLWAGETVTCDGMVRADRAKLYGLSSQPPLLVGAAVSSETAAWVAGWADALITVSQPAPQLVEVVDAFRNNGGKGRPMYLQTQLSYARSEDEALAAAYDQWRMSTLPSDVLWNTALPEQIDAAAESVDLGDLKQRVRISADLDQHRDWLRADRALGFDATFLHNVNRDQNDFIDVFGREVIPRL